MSSRLARSLDANGSAELRELMTTQELGEETTGLADCLHGKRHALIVADVAALLNISERQVYKLAAAHRIPCFKIGGSIRFDPFAISLWLRQKMAPASADQFGGRKARP